MVGCPGFTGRLASLTCWALYLEKDPVSNVRWRVFEVDTWHHPVFSTLTYLHLHTWICVHTYRICECIHILFSVIYFSIAFHISELICSRMHYLEGIVHFEGCGLNKKGKITLMSVKILTGRTLGRNVPLLVGLMLAYSGGTIVSAFLVFFSSVSSSQWLTDVSDQC